MLLVEDLMTDAGSKWGIIAGIREASGTVRDVLVLFDREQGMQAALADQSIKVYAVSDMVTALVVAGEAELLSDNDLKSFESFSKTHGNGIWNVDYSLSKEVELWRSI